ncbi:TBC1 domain family member 15-like isoform X1 [Selaginella moellendorffii]|uniref:TBC1 domain family member 15-like isoform X1 n=1 Tax=Selaginella moellendorffii TaxID=88036 RepID=UPI000D1CB9CA|nr:TBC1 domain family member 15-like isoform X1 [Selaginella moellendorffii]|eukprot:XP_024534235.1 TBC1 domain family member 15-like isoform X1 [Selaginella moellendorffii]
MPLLACASEQRQGFSMEDDSEIYRVRSECQDVATSSVPRRRRRKLSAEKWRAAFDAQGRLNVKRVLRHIERGGVASEIRAHVWEFLLGVYSPGSNAAEREELRQSRRDKYLKLKAECKRMDAAVGSGEVVISPRMNADGVSMEENNPESIEEQTINGVLDPSPSAKIVQWKVLLHQIGLDVVRTDRVLEFYEDPKNLGKLWDILAVYAWIDEEVGYCQGMSDLCSPMVLLFPDEADAFWCFKCLMRRVFITFDVGKRENFRCTNKMMGVQKELSFLAAAMRVIDPKLHRTLEALGGSNYIFAFRMLMVNFRREFSFVDTLTLWEMMWAFEYHPDLQILYMESPDGHIDNAQPDYRAGGRFAKRNIKYGSPRALNEHPSLAVFFVAGILVLLRSKFIKRIQGLDEVVRALNDMSGKIDAYRACQKALKFHKLYLKKVKKSNT